MRLQRFRTGPCSVTLNEVKDIASTPAAFAQDDRRKEPYEEADSYASKNSQTLRLTEGSKALAKSYFNIS
jgi:hypothetical protein